MDLPPIPLFDWLHSHAPDARYLLSFSNMNGLSFESFANLTGFTIPTTFDLGVNTLNGDDTLKAALATMYNTTPSCIVTTTGGSAANFLVFYSMLRPRDEVIVERPSYQPLWLTPQSLGGKIMFCDRNPSESFLIDLNALQESITSKTKLIILTNLHNPTGKCLPRHTLQKISTLARDSHCFVLIDEIFLDGCFTHQSSAAGLPHVIVTSSMTKTYGLGGLRSGWIVASDDVAQHCQTAKAHTTGGSPLLTEHMSAAALLHARAQLKDRFLSFAHTNWHIVKTWVSEKPDLVEWSNPDGGLFCFIKYHSSQNSEALCKYLFDSYGVLLTPGIFFGLDGWFRLSYTCNPQVLYEALSFITDGLRKTQCG